MTEQNNIAQHPDDKAQQDEGSMDARRFRPEAQGEQRNRPAQQQAQYDLAGSDTVDQQEPDPGQGQSDQWMRQQSAHQGVPPAFMTA